MLFDLFLVIGTGIAGYFFIRYGLVCVIGGVSAFFAILWFLLWAALLPVVYLPRYKWLWILQMALIVFYLLFVYHESWFALPWIIWINVLVFLLVHSIFRLTRKMHAF